MNVNKFLKENLVYNLRIIAMQVIEGAYHNLREEALVRCYDLELKHIYSISEIEDTAEFLREHGFTVNVQYDVSVMAISWDND